MITLPRPTRQVVPTPTREVVPRHLEVLSRKPGALAGSTALAAARASGMFTVDHQRFWEMARRRLGDGRAPAADRSVAVAAPHAAGGGGD